MLFWVHMQFSSFLTILLILVLLGQSKLASVNKLKILLFLHFVLYDLELGGFLHAMERSTRDSIDLSESVNDTCHKNFGGKKNEDMVTSVPQSAPLSRKYTFITRPYGQIRKAVPLYK